MSFHIPHDSWASVVNEERVWLYKAPSSYLVTCWFYLLCNLISSCVFSIIHLSCVSTLSLSLTHTHITQLISSVAQNHSRFFTLLFKSGTCRNSCRVRCLHSVTEWGFTCSIEFALMHIAELDHWSFSYLCNNKFQTWAPLCYKRRWWCLLSTHCQPCASSWSGHPQIAFSEGTWVDVRQREYFHGKTKAQRTYTWQEGRTSRGMNIKIKDRSNACLKTIRSNVTIMG